MGKLRLIVLAMLAVFCVGAVAAAAASASEGEFVNSKSEALKKNKFTSTSGVATLETVSGATIVCQTDTNHGIITSKTGGEVTVLFKTCTATGVGTCTGGEDTKKAAEGEIIVLLGLLVKRSSASTRLLLLTVLKPGTKEAGNAVFVCGGVATIEVKGSILTSNNYPTKALSTKYALEFKSKGAKTGEQSVTEYENEKGEKVKCKGLEASIEGLAFEGAGQGGGKLKTEVAKEDALFEEEAQFL
jgi:hypothetical protein